MPHSSLFLVSLTWWDQDEQEVKLTRINWQFHNTVKTIYCKALSEHICLHSDYSSMKIHTARDEDVG